MVGLAKLAFNFCVGCSRLPRGGGHIVEKELRGETMTVECGSLMAFTEGIESLASRRRLKHQD